MSWDDKETIREDNDTTRCTMMNNYTVGIDRRQQRRRAMLW